MGERGVTFIETIILLTVIAAAAAGLSTGLVRINQDVMDGEMTVTAAFLAEEAINEVSAAKFANGYAWITAGNFPSPVILAAPYAAYQRWTTIQEVSPADCTTAQIGSGLKRIDIDIRWGPAATQALRMTTVVGNY